VALVAADLARLAPDDESAEVLGPLLAVRSPLYAERDKREVGRLRAFVVVTLHRIGRARRAWPIIVDLLANSDSPYEFAAAARAAGGRGAAAAPPAPLLTRALDPAYGDDLFSLERYSPTHPEPETTPATIEAVVALGKIGPAALPALDPLRHLIARREA